MSTCALFHFTIMTSITYRELFNLLKVHRKNLKDHELLLDMVLANNSFNFSQYARSHLSNPLRIFCKHLYKKWCDASRNYEYFIKKYQTWLDTKLHKKLPKEALETIPLGVDSSKSAKNETNETILSIVVQTKEETNRNIKSR